MACPIYTDGFDFNWYFQYYDEDLYEAPMRFNIYVPVDPKCNKEPEFCTLTWNKDQIFIEVDILTSLLSKSNLENFWAAYHDDRSGSVPFFIWEIDGTQYKKKTSMWIDPSKPPYNNDRGRWVADQLARWKEVVKATLSGVPGAFYGRLLNPFKDKYLKPSDVAFTPRLAKNPLDLVISVDDLKTVFVPVLKKRINGGESNIMSFDDANKKGFRCIGTDLFGNYCTWVNPTSYKEMWGKLDITDLALKWPNETDAKNAAAVLKDDPIPLATTDNDILNVRITMAKIIAAFDVQKRDPDQGTVMGASATAIVGKFWDWKGKDAEGKAEWLHRSAFHFGGIENGFSPQSSQSWKNLIFGTKESNTDMIRAESAIDQYLAQFSEIMGDTVPKDEIGGTLTTVNNRTDGVSRRKTDGTKDDKPRSIDKWVRDRKYRWLSFNLEYTWKMDPLKGQKRRKLNLPSIGSTNFDPLSQYRPMQIEGQLDTALIAFIFSGFTASTSGLATDIKKPTAAPIPTIYDNSTKKISLFGKSELSATLVTYTVHDPKTAADKAKLAAVATLSNSGQSLSLVSVFPALAGTAFQSIAFQDVAFLQQNFDYDDTKGVGWHVSATWVIGSSSGNMQPLLKNVLGVDKTSLSIYAALGTKAGWDRVLDTQSFAMEGVFAGLNYSPAKINWIQVTSIGARLFGVRVFSPFPTPTTNCRYGYGIFGTINFDVPGSVTPLEFRYDMSEFNGLVSLSADIVGDVWKNALGVEGLTLRSVDLATDFALSSPWASASFDISAAFLFRYTTFLLRGSFASKTDYSLTATISNFSLNTIKDLYEHIAKKTLVLPDVDVTIGSATISITSAKSLTIALQNVQVNGHTSANALLTISPSGVVLRGDLTSSSITFADIELKKAFLQIQFAPASSPLKTDVSLGGEIVFSGLTFNAAVHLYKDTKGVQWTVFASLTPNDITLELKKLLPEVAGTCLEKVALRQVAFVAASKDDPYLGGNVVPGGYKIHGGVQVWATIVTIDAIHDMARHDVNGLVLGAAWSKTGGFVFDVIIPNPIQFNLNTGVRTEPIKIELRTKPVQLVISAGVRVQVPGSDELTFSIGFAAGITDASITAQMVGTWKNPLGISANVSVSNVGLKLRIIYAQFFSTGLPSGFGIAGGLAMGNTSATFALNIDEDPSKELLLAQANNLSLTDLVAFARTVTKSSIPEPPKIVDFSSLKIYICTGNIQIGSNKYPPGFAFSAKGTIYSNDFDLACSINSGDVNFKASTSNFYLWAVTLKNTSLEGAVGPSRQYLKMNGTVIVDLWITTVNISAFFYIQLNPSFNISFSCSISFGSSSLAATGKDKTTQTVELTGKPVGAVTSETAKNATILLTGNFNDALVSGLQNQVHRLFDTARRFEQEGKASLRTSLDKEQQDINKRLQQARADAKTADDAWQGVRKATVKSAENVIADYDLNLNVLQQSYSKAWHRFNDALDGANLRVQAKEYERVVRIRDAQYKVDAMEREMNLRVLEAVRVEEDARKDIFRKYGDAPQDLQNAQAKAASLRNEHTELKGDIGGLTGISQPWMNSRASQTANIASSVDYRATLASTIVNKAASTIASNEYKGMQAKIDSAHQSLVNTQSRTKDNLERSRSDLRSVTDQTNKAVADAHALLTGVQTGGDKKSLEKAVVDLVNFRKTNDAKYDKAHETIRDVEKLPEFARAKDAQAKVATVNGELANLQGVNMAFDLISNMTSAERSLGQWMTTRPTSLSISDVQLKGDMAFFGANGVAPKPLQATVKTKVMGVEHVVNSQWSPDKAATFTNDIFKSTWGELGRARARS